MLSLTPMPLAPTGTPYRPILYHSRGRHISAEYIRCGVVFRYCTIPRFHEDKFRCERSLEVGVDYYDVLYEFKWKLSAGFLSSLYKAQTATCNNLSNILKHFSTKQP